MPAYQSQDIRIVEIELSSRCNAACPMCGRFAGDGTTKLNPVLELNEITLEEFKVVMPQDFVRQLDKVVLCGNYGDPIAAQDLLEIVAYMRETSPTLAIAVHTNGSARTTEWWKQMGHLLAVTGSYVQFAIDGLGEVNALYRRGTDFNKIIQNAKTLIAAGGGARWQFIAFQHNEHQIEQARALAAKLGFERFELKRTSRFQFQGPAYGEAFLVRNKDGEVTHTLKQPVGEAYQSPAYGNLDKVIAEHGNLDAYYNVTPITCKMAAKKRIYIDASSRVWPCAYTAKQQHSRIGEGLRAIFDQIGGVEMIDARKHPITEIIDGPFFRAVEESWSKGSCSAGKLKVCSRFCGAVNVIQE